MPVAFPADHDDDHCGDLRSTSAGTHYGRWRGTAPAAGDIHCRRAFGQSVADALHHARRLSVPRSVLDLVEAILAAEIFRDFWSASRSMTAYRLARGVAALCPAAALLTGCELGPNYM